MALVNVCSILLVSSMAILRLETTQGWTTPFPARNWNRLYRKSNVRSRRSWRRFLSTETKESVANGKSVRNTSRKKEADLVSMIDSTKSNTKRKRTHSMVSKPDKEKGPSVGAATWMDRVQELLLFSQTHGHTRVPKRYKKNPALGNWVNKQRQLYRNYLQGTKPCSLTKERINILNEIGFVWDATTKEDYHNVHSIQGEDEWWTHFRELERLLVSRGDKLHNTHTAIPLATPIGKWLQQQRKNYQQQREGSDFADSTPRRLSPARGVGRPKHPRTLKTTQLHALQKLDKDWWMSHRQWQWTQRYRELLDYIKQHGDCCVPISHHNKQLAHWVSNQRKQYNLRSQGKPSDMTTERIEKLNAIGFVWNRWDYEFAKNQDKWMNGDGF